MKKVLMSCVLILVCVFSFNIKASAINYNSFDDYYILEGDNFNFSKNTVYYSDDSEGILYLYDYNYDSKYNGTFEKYLDTDFNKLSEDKKLQVAKIIKYGFGYSTHTDIAWYKVTQIMIWEVIYDAKGYVAKDLNGTKIDNYDLMVDEINNLVNGPSLDDIEVKYGKSVLIKGLTYDYILDTVYPYSLSKTGTVLYNVNKDSVISFTEGNTNNQTGKMKYFVLDDKPVFIRGGEFYNEPKHINVNVLKGSINIKLNDSKDYYSSADNSNLCYEIYHNLTLVDTLCYKNGTDYTITNYQGDYYYKQVSSGIGYLDDGEEYEFTIGNDNEDLIINSNPITNNISFNHLYCVDDVCSPLSDVKYYLYNNISKELIGEYHSNSEGKLNLKLGYGEYLLEQKSGMLGFTISAPVRFQVKEDSKEQKFVMKNKFISKGEFVDVVIDQKNDNILNNIIVDNEDKIDNENEVIIDEVNNDNLMVDNSDSIMLDKKDDIVIKEVDDSNDLNNQNIDTIDSDDVAMKDVDELNEIYSDRYYDETVDNPHTGYSLHARTWVIFLTLSEILRRVIKKK